MKRLSIVFLFFAFGKPSFAQKMTAASSKLPKLEIVSSETVKEVSHHPTIEFRRQFVTSWIMAEHYKLLFSGLSEQDKKDFLKWVEQESKAYRLRREIIWRQIEKQNPQLVKWLIRELSDSLLSTFVAVKTEDYASAPIAVPIIDYYQCQVADMYCLEYFCLYKALNGELKYNAWWFAGIGQPMPNKVIVALRKSQVTPFVQKQKD